MQPLAPGLKKGDTFRSCLRCLLPSIQPTCLSTSPLVPYLAWTPHQTLQQRAWLPLTSPLMAHTVLPHAMYCCPERKYRKVFTFHKSWLWCQLIRSPTNLWNQRWGRSWKPLMVNVCCSRVISPRFWTTHPACPRALLPHAPSTALSSLRVRLHRLFICTQLSLKIISDYLPVQSQKQVDQLLLCFTSGYPSKGRERENQSIMVCLARKLHFGPRRVIFQRVLITVQFVFPHVHDPVCSPVK